MQLIFDKVKASNILLTDLFYVFGLEQEKVLDLLNHDKVIFNSYQQHVNKLSIENTVNRIYSQVLSSGANNTFNSKFKAIINLFFERLFLSDVGRYKINHKLFVGSALYNRVLAQNLVDYRSKKVIFPKGT